MLVIILKSVVYVSDNPTIEIIRDDAGNIMDEDDDLSEAIEPFERYGERALRCEQDEEAQLPPAEVEVDQTSHRESTVAAEGTREQQPINDKEVQGEKPTIMSTSSYTSMDFADDDVMSLSGYKAEDLHEVRSTDYKLALEVHQIWQRKYIIGGKVELYYGVEMERYP